MADTLSNDGTNTRDYSTHFARITCLLMREGTERMRKVTTDNLPPRQSLKQSLESNRETFKRLKKRGIISDKQHDIIYPEDGDITIMDIDMTLWVILARNVTLKSRRKYINWQESPEPHQLMWPHDFIRLKEIRNFLFHASLPELDQTKFNEIKNDLTSVLHRLGSCEDTIIDLLSQDLDPGQTEIYTAQLKNQYMEEKLQDSLQKGKLSRNVHILNVVIGLLTFVVFVALVSILSWYFTQKIPCAKGILRLHSDSGILNFMPRKAWGAREPHDPDSIPKLQTPFKKAVVLHTSMVMTECSVTTDCCDVVRFIQDSEMDGKFGLHWQDIAYNYLIGNDGVVYEGRGSKYIGGAVWKRNSEMISFGLLGNYVCVPPSRTALMALYSLLEYLQWDDPTNTDPSQRNPILVKDYELYGHCQVNLVTPDHNVTFKDSPGAATMWEISHWNHWRADNITACDIDKDCLITSNCCKKNCDSNIMERLKEQDPTVSLSG